MQGKGREKGRRRQAGRAPRNPCLRQPFRLLSARRGIWLQAPPRSGITPGRTGRLPNKGLLMNLVVFFDQPEAGLVSVAGGKGSNLSVLTAAGFPVPPGFVVTAPAYRLFLAASEGLDQELAAFDYARPEVL